jgi:hypothetical protein
MNRTRDRQAHPAAKGQTPQRNPLISNDWKPYPKSLPTIGTAWGQTNSPPKTLCPCQPQTTIAAHRDGSPYPTQTSHSPTNHSLSPQQRTQKGQTNSPPTTVCPPPPDWADQTAGRARRPCRAAIMNRKKTRKNRAKPLAEPRTPKTPSPTRYDPRVAPAAVAPYRCMRLWRAPPNCASPEYNPAAIPPAWPADSAAGT